GVLLTEDEQRSDWGRRPLSPEQLAYAFADVQHLLALRERMGVRLSERGLLSEAEAEFARLTAKEPRPRQFDAEGWQKMKAAPTPRARSPVAARRARPGGRGALRKAAQVAQGARRCAQGGSPGDRSQRGADGRGAERAPHPGGSGTGRGNGSLPRPAIRPGDPHRPPLRHPATTPLGKEITAETRRARRIRFQKNLRVLRASAVIFLS